MEEYQTRLNDMFQSPKNRVKGSDHQRYFGKQLDTVQFQSPKNRVKGAERDGAQRHHIRAHKVSIPYKSGQGG